MSVLCSICPCTCTRTTYPVCPMLCRTWHEYGSNVELATHNIEVSFKYVSILCVEYMLHCGCSATAVSQCHAQVNVAPLFRSTPNPFTTNLSNPSSNERVLRMCQASDGHRLHVESERCSFIQVGWSKEAFPGGCKKGFTAPQGERAY